MPDSPQPAPRIAVIGGGAAGFFAAITAAESNPAVRVELFEKSTRFLGKVKISGGGRCNVTHACFDPSALAEHYPRGGRELRGAFHRWQPRDTIDWFEGRGVALKTEEDGRVFPVSDDSRTIIDCLIDSAREAGVVLRPGVGISSLKRHAPDFELTLTGGETRYADRVFLAPGSLRGSPLVASLESLGHTIESLAPSLFALDVRDERIRNLPGLSVENARAALAPKGKPHFGPLLVTHKGLSGPAILRLSAWEARRMRELGYRAELAVSWLCDTKPETLKTELASLRRSHGKRTVRNTPAGGLPARLWDNLVAAAGIAPDTPWGRLPRSGENALTTQLLDSRFAVIGKTMNKEEFVTCGGVRLREVDFRTMESRLVPGLHFGGECLDLDGVTGGFNFQAAWTTGFLAGRAMSAAATGDWSGS